MLAAVRGYYDGRQIVVDEVDRKNFNAGDEVIITILDNINTKKAETREERRRRIIASGAYVTSSGRTAEEIDDYIREMRDDDRF